MLSRASPDEDRAGPLETAGARSVLGQAHHLYIAMATSGGPHITPELFVVHAGRLWCLLAASTLKARRLSRGEPVGVYVPGPDFHLVGSGRAVVVDPARPLSLVREPSAAAAAPTAVGLYALRNSAELTGAAMDLLRGRLGGPFPPRRVALCIDVSEARVAGWTGASTWTSAQAGPPGPHRQSSAVPEGLPPGMGELLADGPAAVAWSAAGGAPVAVPGRWHAATSTVLIPAMPPSPARDTPVRRETSVQIAVTRDSWSGLGPSGKQGIMIRGRATVSVTAADAPAGAVGIDIERWTFWDGIATGTVERPDGPCRPRPA